MLDTNQVFKIHFNEKPRPRYICLLKKKDTTLSKASAALLDYFSSFKL